MTVLVTGAAGFIGSQVATALLARGERVVGVDSMNAYYDPALKEARLARLEREAGFTFVRADIADRDTMLALPRRFGPIGTIVHLAAQAGVRHSLTHPFDYAAANLVGHLTMLELARSIRELGHMVYASSSSVYGGNTKLPFAVEDRVDRPISLYAATKRADELMSASYAHLYGIPLTGLRFFTVYGPWGRPDMAAYIFTRRILAGEPITVFNDGDLERDFTYVDDIVAGVLGCLDRPPETVAGERPHRIYNLGNNRAEPLMRFIGVLEAALGRKAEIRFAPMQPGDVRATFADIAASTRDFGFEPRVTIDEGLPRFVAWYRDYHGA